jgi:hypothetical protein
MKFYFIIIAILFSMGLKAELTDTDILVALRQMTSQTLADDVDPNSAIRAIYRVCPTKEAVHSTLSNACKKKTPPQLRNLFSSFFAARRVNSDPVKDKKEKEALARKLSKLMGMIIKESSGNPAAVSDMQGRGSYNSYMSFFKINNSGGLMWKDHYGTTELLEKLMKQSNVTFDKQTNFGLAQLSADRLVIPRWGGNYLKEKQKMISLMNGKTFVEWCMTKSIYKDSENELEQYFNEKIKNCEMGISKKSEIQCFGRSVNFCPRLSIELAMEQPARYFETRHADPFCAELFK